MTLEQDFVKILQSSAGSHLALSTNFNQTLFLENINQILWPDTGFRKRDLLVYYSQVAPWLLPVLNEQKLQPIHYPNGIAQDYFPAKLNPQRIPNYLIPVLGQDLETVFVLVHNLESLLYLVNLGCIQFSITPENCLVWQITVSKPTTEQSALRLASGLFYLLQDRQLQPSIKTIAVQDANNKDANTDNWAYGVDVVLPVSLSEEALTPEECHQLFQSVNRHLCNLLIDQPELGGVHIAQRYRLYEMRTPLKESLYGSSQAMDYCLTHPKPDLIVPYSVLPTPDALVSAPLQPQELLDDTLSARRFHLGNMSDRIEEVGDLWQINQHPGHPKDRILNSLLHA